MQHYSPLEIPPQKDVLTLKDARQRMANWRKLMSNFYSDPKRLPKGVFIPFEDIAELAKLQQQVPGIKEPGSKEMKDIYIVGVRGYFSFPLPEEVPINQKDADYPVDLIMVPVYQVNPREKGSPGEFEYNKHHPTYDLVVNVPSAGSDNDTTGDKYSIYDITQPCPKLCDADNTLG